MRRRDFVSLLAGAAAVSVAQRVKVGPSDRVPVLLERQ